MNRKALLLLAILCLTSVSYAQTPNFDYPFLLTNGEGFMVDGDYYAIPCVGDWDGDNDLDLLVNLYYDDNIIYYENISTGIEPEYADSSILYADGMTFFAG